MDTKEPPDEFIKFFSEQYGDRWNALFRALKQPEKQVVRWSKWTDAVPPSPELQIDWLPGCYWREGLSVQENQRDQEGLLSYYIMDPASVLAARSLPLEGGTTVLDMCAAPGGKSLVLIENMSSDARIVVNEPSAARRERLKKVLRQYVPDSLRGQLQVKGLDGLKYGLKAKNDFDRVLVDAPCSGERHLLQTPNEMSGWSLSRTKGLAKRQYGLLSAAAESLRDGGYVLYSTCSISSVENDEVVDRLIRKRKGEIVQVPLSDPTGVGELTDRGLIYLPDVCGFGPLYFSLLKKMEKHP